MVFENRINFSIHTLILSAHALIVSGNAISLFAHALIASVRTLIALAHALIAPENPIRIRAHALIASTLPSDIAYSSTVPSGDTPCLTADDAQRTNPWIGDAQTSDAGSVAQHPLPPPKSLFFRCHIVTLSHFDHNRLIMSLLQA